MKVFIIQDRETGTEINWFRTMEEAQEELARYEKEDMEEGTYSEDFYEIVEREDERITDERMITDEEKNDNDFLYRVAENIAMISSEHYAEIYEITDNCTIGTNSIIIRAAIDFERQIDPKDDYIEQIGEFGKNLVEKLKGL